MEEASFLAVEDEEHGVGFVVEQSADEVEEQNTFAFMLPVKVENRSRPFGVTAEIMFSP